MSLAAHPLVFVSRDALVSWFAEEVGGFQEGRMEAGSCSAMVRMTPSNSFAAQRLAVRRSRRRSKTCPAENVFLGEIAGSYGQERAPYSFWSGLLMEGALNTTAPAPGQTHSSRGRVSMHRKITGLRVARG